MMKFSCLREEAWKRCQVITSESRDFNVTESFRFRQNYRAILTSHCAVDMSSNQVENSKDNMKNIVFSWGGAVDQRWQDKISRE